MMRKVAEEAKNLENEHVNGQRNSMQHVTKWVEENSKGSSF